MVLAVFLLGRHAQFFQMLDVGDDGVSARKCSDSVERMITLTSEPDSIQLNNKIVRERTLQHVFMELFVRCRGHNWSLGNIELSMLFEI